ncbi:hypothetical protein J5N97_013909 [Dioscorea zingiberensis]|uniref:Kinesin-like protein n=1 Tax=Dioscorea zingiberensis TaxID=325984 RepID=A0A9D5HJ21_9LILI|nr:hypothetical protein J5N97_013909 [Dioscorea zingiberensis]
MSPSLTPKSSEKWGRDLRSNENGSSSKHDKEKGVNVQVLLRCRPLSEDELRVNTPAVISCNELRREITAIQNIANKQIDRTFAFDKVFGPTSQQKDLFDLAVSPVVNEDGELPSDAGVIPRAVQQIFDILESQNADYNMKVTFLELYNEEITDLLAMEESKLSDDKSKKPIALMEDGKGGVLVRGLEEEIVSSAGEIYKILDKGSAKRRTAETLLNKQSSRSHSIFSITIHIKECTPEGEEMIKSGKLNLVDLAGSENISRSGAREVGGTLFLSEGRAREAGEINKSLLTLGRVINALVEHSGHIPYRDSKLTRLLRDSLGGKNKTCIIATISPSIYCLEETLSTLDYAHRTKISRIKPEINQKMMKSALIKDLYTEIDRLKQEVNAARDKNGIYIPRDHYLLDEAERRGLSISTVLLMKKGNWLAKKVAEMLASSNARKKKLEPCNESQINNCIQRLSSTASTTLEDVDVAKQQPPLSSIQMSGNETNQQLHSRLSSTASTTLEDVDVANNSLLSSIQCSLKLDHDACTNVDSMIVPAHEKLRELKGVHHHKIIELSENAGKCLVDEYMVDEPSCSTPKKRELNLPSMTSIEELRTPPFEELLKSFWEAKSPSKQANGDVKHVHGTHDSRPPLTTIN